MTTIKCPICQERLSAAHGEELSAELKAHLASTHGLEMPEVEERTGRFHVPPTDYSPDSMTLREAEGPVRPSWKEEARLWTAPPVRSAEEQRREEALHQPVPEAARARPAGPAVTRGPAPPPAAELLHVKCPVCGALVTARDEDELSEDLREHMADLHDLRTLREAWQKRTA